MGGTRLYNFSGLWLAKPALGGPRRSPPKGGEKLNLNGVWRTYIHCNKGLMETLITLLLRMRRISSWPPKAPVPPAHGLHVTRQLYVHASSPHLEISCACACAATTAARLLRVASLYCTIRSINSRASASSTTVG
jgi:hypothetical protein